MMRKWLLLLLTILISARVTAAEDPSDDPHVSLVALKAIPIALRRFHKQQPKVDDGRFDVFVREKEDVVEVEFVPEPSPLKEGCDSKDCFITMDVGGRTVYGYNVIYVIDKKSRRILKTITPK